METVSCKSEFVNVSGIRLHYLDWGGNGNALLFLGGKTCSTHIFSEFAPRFTDNFHVLALDRRGHGDSDYPETGYDADTLTEDLRQFLETLAIEQVILVGHSMARVELCHFTALYPDRVLKLIFLDAAYDSSLPETRAVMEKDPFPAMIPLWPEDEHDTIDDYIATIKGLYPVHAVIWGNVMELDTKHSVKTVNGKVVDKMTDAISKAINETLAVYSPEYSEIHVPVLSFFAIPDGSDFLSPDYMTEEQKKEIIDYYKTVAGPYIKEYIEQFQSMVPQAKIVEISNGHHYCFIKQEELVFEEMRKFLLET